MGYRFIHWDTDLYKSNDFFLNPICIFYSRLYCIGGGRVVRWCLVNFKCRGVLLIWIRVGQGPTTLEVGAGGDCLDIFSLVYHFSFLSPSLWEAARYRLKYCFKGPLSPKQPTNQIVLYPMMLKCCLYK